MQITKIFLLFLTWKINYTIRLINGPGSDPGWVSTTLSAENLGHWKISPPVLLLDWLKRRFTKWMLVVWGDTLCFAKVAGKILVLALSKSAILATIPPSFAKTAKNFGRGLGSIKKEIGRDFLAIKEKEEICIPNDCRIYFRTTRYLNRSQR